MDTVTAPLKLLAIFFKFTELPVPVALIVVVPLALILPCPFTAAILPLLVLKLKLPAVITPEAIEIPEIPLATAVPELVKVTLLVPAFKPLMVKVPPLEVVVFAVMLTLPPNVPGVEPLALTVIPFLSFKVKAPILVLVATEMVAKSLPTLSKVTAPLPVLNMVFPDTVIVPAPLCVIVPLPDVVKVTPPMLKVPNTKLALVTEAVAEDAAPPEPVIDKVPKVLPLLFKVAG